MTKEQLLEHISELFTKEEVIAILEEILLEIDEKSIEKCGSCWWLGYNDIVQKRINALKKDKCFKDLGIYKNINKTIDT